MRYRAGLLAVVVAVLAIAALLFTGGRNRGGGTVQAEVVGYGPAGDPSGFARATEPRRFRFPEDHGEHPEFQTEWWYYTGNLESEDGRAFGYQLTFFRRALSPESPERESALATGQAYMAHFAVTDVAGGQMYSYERLERGGLELAGAQAVPYRVWLDDWNATEVEPGVVRLSAVAPEGPVAIDLTVRERKEPILQGDAGLSPKSAEPGNASYYYSLTRLETAGTVRIADSAFAVAGWSWMDHEFGTSTLGPKAVGWDWFSLQFEDGRELMYFQIRQEDGTIEPLSSGTLIEADGSTRRLARDDVRIETLSTWKSPRTGAAYPSEWRVRVLPTGESFEIRPVLADQELQVSGPYWEGAVRIYQAGQAIGVGYIEMTGYTGSMRGQF